MDNTYFSRAATWHLMDGHIVAHDSFSPKAPRVITMEPWPEVVFSMADGQHTVGEFIQHMSAQYPDRIPAGLPEQIHQIIRDLVEEGILSLHQAKKPLPAYFAEEISKVPPEVRKALMEEDGLLPRTPK
jgi:hypothetical protein